jgi:hypothetical protein
VIVETPRLARWRLNISVPRIERCRTGVQFINAALPANPDRPLGHSRHLGIPSRGVVIKFDCWFLPAEKDAKDCARSPSPVGIATCGDEGCESADELTGIPGSMRLLFSFRSGMLTKDEELTVRRPAVIESARRKQKNSGG